MASSRVNIQHENMIDATSDRAIRDMTREAIRVMEAETGRQSFMSLGTANQTVRGNMTTRDSGGGNYPNFLGHRTSDTAGAVPFGNTAGPTARVDVEVEGLRHSILASLGSRQGQVMQAVDEGILLAFEDLPEKIERIARDLVTKIISSEIEKVVGEYIGSSESKKRIHDLVVKAIKNEHT